MSDNVLHSSASDSWRTPPDILDRCRHVLEGIDLDPCSTYAANVEVMAEQYYTAAHDALSFTWADQVGQGLPVSVFCNPPGGKVGNRSKPVLFWEHLCDLRASGKLRSAIFLGFSIELLQTTQGCRTCALDLPFCIPRQRIRFLAPDGSKALSPTHGNVLVYMPGIEDRTRDFVSAFSTLGKVVVPSAL
jgi:hypothetical protein